MNIKFEVIADVINYRFGRWTLLVAAAFTFAGKTAWSQDPGYTPLTASSGVLTAPTTFSAIELTNGKSDLLDMATAAMRLVCLDGAERTAAVAVVNNAQPYYGPWMETLRAQPRADNCPKGWYARVDSTRTYLPNEVPAYLVTLGKVFVKRSAKDFGTETQVDDYYPGGARSIADLQTVIRSERWNVSILNSPFLSLDQKKELRAKIEAGDCTLIPYSGPIALNSGALSKATPDQIATGAHRKYILLDPKPGEKPVMVFRCNLSDGAVVDIPSNCVNIDHHVQLRQVFVTRVFKNEEAERCKYNKDLLASSADCHAPIIATNGGVHCKFNNPCGWLLEAATLFVAGKVACHNHFVICKESDSPKKSEGNHGTPTLTIGAAIPAFLRIH